MTHLSASLDSGFSWQEILESAVAAAPEAFDPQGRPLPLELPHACPASWKPAVTGVDGSVLGPSPQFGVDLANEAVQWAADHFEAWAALSLMDRSHRVRRALDNLKRNREIIARLLAWEIGKTMPTARADVDRCIDGVDWYLEHIAAMMEDRRPLGLVSNIASWNYPFSVLTMTCLVQALAGNIAIAKAPAQGGVFSLTLGFAMLQRAGVPVMLVGGSGRELSAPLTEHPAIAGVAFVGGRKSGQEIARKLRTSGKRYSLEMEGVNSYSVWNFSDWASLSDQILKGFEYGKQRCTAYTRWVVQASLVDDFLSAYRQAASKLVVGHPLLGAESGGHAHFGPLIHGDKADLLRRNIELALAGGAEILHRTPLAEDRFLDGQDRRAYLEPTLLMGTPRDNDLYTHEPFGPVDLLVAVETEEELVREANVSGGALVASLATDDLDWAKSIEPRIQAYKVGVNRLRSRGDKEEGFGGLGGSWEGAFVGGTNLVHAFTDGPGEPPGNRFEG